MTHEYVSAWSIRQRRGVRRPGPLSTLHVPLATCHYPLFSKQVSAAAADPGMSPALRSVGLLDLLSKMPAGPSVARLVSMPICAASLRNLVRKADQEFGLFTQVGRMDGNIRWGQIPARRTECRRRGNRKKGLSREVISAVYLNKSM
jgi:hypothetical protein